MTGDRFRCICDPTNLFDPPDPTPVAVEGCPAHRARRIAQQWKPKECATVDVIGQIKRGPELYAFLAHMSGIITDSMRAPMFEVLVTVDNDGVKVKVNGGPWSRPFGRVKP